MYMCVRVCGCVCGCVLKLVDDSSKELHRQAYPYFIRNNYKHVHDEFSVDNDTRGHAYNT